MQCLSQQDKFSIYLHKNHHKPFHNNICQIYKYHPDNTWKQEIGDGYMWSPQLRVDGKRSLK